MKNFIFLLFPLVFTFLSKEAGNVDFSRAENPPVELKDLKDIEFAWNLKDWEGDPVDSLSLDIYYPTGAASNIKYPVVVFCHAGGFTGGNKSNVSSLCDQLADYGFAVVAFDYRTGYIQNNPRACTTDTTTLRNAVYRSIQDGNACLRFVKAKGAKYNLDTSWIFYGGSSAGASVALNSAYCNDSIAKIYFSRCYKDLGSVEKSGNTLPSNYSIKGIAAMWGSLFSDKVIDSDFHAYPTILFKGDEDSGLPDSVGYYFGCANYAPALFAGAGVYAPLIKQKAPAVFYELPGANHPAYDDDFCMQNIACFFKNVMTGKPYSGRYNYYKPSCPQFEGEF